MSWDPDNRAALARRTHAAFAVGGTPAPRLPQSAPWGQVVGSSGVQALKCRSGSSLYVPYPCVIAGRVRFGETFSGLLGVARSTHCFWKQHDGAAFFNASHRSVFAALFPASVATHDTKSEPQQGPEDGDDDRIEPRAARRSPRPRSEALIFSVFWMMNIRSSPTPMSDAIAPPPSRELFLLAGPESRSDMTTPLLTLTTGQSAQRVYRACHMAGSATLIPSVSRDDEALAVVVEGISAAELLQENDIATTEA